jgi:phosphate transport system substrate-binding protein
VHAGGTAIDAPLFEELGSLLQPRRITLDYQELATPELVRGDAPTAIPLVAAAAGSAVGVHGDQPSEPLFPIAFDAVSVVYNLPGVSSGIRLDPKALAAMLSGKVALWSAKPIAAENPGVKLPRTPITIVHPSGPSLLTELLSEYLAAGSRQWRRSIGIGAVLNWPAGTSVADEADVISLVTQTPGAIGYVGQATARINGAASAYLRNPAGGFVAPSLAAMTAVGAQHAAASATSLVTVDAPGRQSYPIVAEEYAKTFVNQCAAGFSPALARAVAQLLHFLLGPSGQALVQRFSLAPLPLGLRARAEAAIGRLNCAGRPL